MKKLLLAFTITLSTFGALTMLDPSGTFSAQAQTTLTDGEVRRVDKDAKKLTIRHGPILNLDMPAMTMVFQVKNPALLDKVNTGDKIRFAAEKSDGAYIVTAIEITK